MKSVKNRSIQYAIILHLINALIVFIFIFLYIEKIKLSYFLSLCVTSLAVMISIISTIITIKFKNYVNELESQLEMFKAILESSPNAILVHKKLQIIYANNKGAELFDLESSSEIIGKPLESFINLNKDVIGTERLENALNETDFEPLVEEVYYKKNGQMIELQVSSTPVKINNSICVLNLCENITEKKRIIELEEKIKQDEKRLRDKIELEKLKEEFFANLSHELRTPLAIILGTLQLIEISSKVQDHNLEKNYKILKQNCYRLLKLVNNLLDSTKIDSGYFSLTRDNYNIVSAIEDTTLSVLDYVKGNGLNIVFDTNVEEKIINCDIDSIERIILNLLSNAIKFTPKGGTIFVNVIDEGNNVKITVKDTGIGIKEEHFDLVFDRFKQVDKSLTRNQEGSGIGLSLVKSLVEMNGGKISLFSQFGKGSEFIIKLPANNEIIGQDVHSIIEKEKFIREKINIEFSDI